MTLTFPNASRSFEARHHGVLFWGHDGTLEVSFLIDVAAVARLAPETGNGEAEVLAAFDSARERIHRVALHTYVTSSRRSLYLLHPEDF